MARTIKDIQDSIALELQNKKLKLSDSNVAEWRLWTYVFAAAIHSFEVILDLFKKEIDIITNKITPGTIRWYAEMCYRFQNGHELLFDNKTAMLYYAVDDPKARIVKVVAITESESGLIVKVSKTDDTHKIIPLSSDELYNFGGYIDSVKFAGVNAEVVSTTADLIRYDIEVFYEPSIPVTSVQKNVEQTLTGFKTSLSFDAMFYPQQMIDAVMAVDGVVTVNLRSISCKGTPDADFVSVGVMAELYSGYFEYDQPNCSLTFTSIKNKA